MTVLDPQQDKEIACECILGNLLRRQECGNVPAAGCQRIDEPG